LSSDPSGGEEEEVRRLVLAYQQYQNQADALVRQLSITQLTAEGLDRAARAVEALGSASEGQEMLVSIGSGSYVHARLSATDKVVLNVGAGVSIEKTAADAKEDLKVRQAEVAEGSKKLSEMLTRIDQEMQKIQAILTRYEQQEGGSGQQIV
jgi:prefoldin alpha subunit